LDASTRRPFIDTYTKVSFAKFYDRKTPITAADLLNDRVLPFFEEHDVKLLRVLTDRGSEFCGNPERHEYELYLAVEDIDHSRTKTKSPQANGICERFHKTALNEFYRVRSAKRYIVQSTNCSTIWTRGSKNTMRHGHIKDLVLRQNPDADLPGCNADNEGENDRHLTATDTKTCSLNQAPAARFSSGYAHTHIRICCGWPNVPTRWAPCLLT
jgi:hypothetical protein